MDKQLHQQIEQLREKMIARASHHKSLLHQEVLHLSQALDLLIVNVQRQRQSKRVAGQPEASGR